ncbi:oligosaccharide flippase family protein [Halorubellus sp. JP-L1]|uniref:oligosaccharide flippase family protein n=1 Tax=Halorubellus sp. JP-L1 TaxID=2715753 RepID=UPI001408EC81|nr:polysaccharide biosynthesis C-terminal domain-containing protein [Halorubellus sp. JP-L1]NHN43178.1 oligosaccharide flippase family protein [Halorubellus sp. JP-L1]
MAGFENFTERLASIVSARVLKLVVTFVSTPIVVRLLEPSGYGDYAVLLSVFAVFILPVSAAVTEGVQKYVGEERADEVDWQERVVAFYAIFGGVLIVGAVLVMLAFTALGGAAWLFGDAFTLYFYLLAGHVFFAQFRAIGYHAVLGFGNEKATATFDVAKKLLTMVVGIGLVLALGVGVEGMLVGHVVANLIIAIAAGALVLRTIDVTRLSLPSLRDLPLRELAAFNAMNIVLVLLVRSMAHVDVVMLRVITESSTTGFYKAALSTAEYIWIVPMALQTVLLHSSSGLWSENRTDEITDIATRITRYNLLLVILLAIGMATLVDRFVPLYFGNEYTASIVPLLVLLPGVVGFAAARPLQAIGQGSGRMRTLVLAVGGAAALNLALNALLIPTYGMIGAAAATSIGYGSMFGFLTWSAYRLGYDPLADVRAVRIGLTAALTTPVVWGVDQLVASDILALFVVPPIGLVAYLVVAVNVRAIDVDEILAIVDRAPPRIGGPIRTALAWVD